MLPFCIVSNFDPLSQTRICRVSNGGYLFLGKRWCLGVADGRRLGREHVAINPCVYFLRADDHSIGVCRGSRHAAPPRSRLRQPHPTSGGGQGRRRESHLLHYPLTEIARRVNVDSKQYPPPEPTNSLIPE